MIHHIQRGLVLPALPKTGQTTQYAAGDDGALQFGAPRPTRFIANGDGTVTDVATGLMWVAEVAKIIPGVTGVHPTNQCQVPRNNWTNATPYAKADLALDTADTTYWVCAVAHTSAAAPTTFAQDRAANPTYWRQSLWTGSAANLVTTAQVDWPTAVAQSLGTALGGTGLSYAGYDDWRLPNVLELLTLVDYSRTAIPMIYVTPFPNTHAMGYWSSTTYERDNTFGMAVLFNLATISSIVKTDNTRRLQPVRGGHKGT